MLGFIAALFVGLSLGLIGGGGAILTMPLLVYLFHVDPMIATAYSLFIVGVTSAVGAFMHHKDHPLNFKVAFQFGLVSMLVVIITRSFLVPHIPANIATIGGYTLTSGAFTMILFAVLMIWAGYAMVKKNRLHNEQVHPSKAKLIFYGALTGLITGLLGAGGGFLLIPALVLIVKLPMKEAVGTSLLLIALNALVGFASDLAHIHFDWPLLLGITIMALLGLWGGTKIGTRVDAVRLKSWFGYFLWVMAVFILVKI